jgi:hypothetical protein
MLTLRRLLQAVIVLALAGFAPTSFAQTDLRAGYAKVDITPSGPVWLGGYDLRNAPSDGVYPGEKLFVRALVLDDGKTRTAFIMSDIIGTRGHGRLREMIAKEAGIPADNILLGDVHNHSAPSPNPDRNAEWTRQFESALVAAAKQALADLRPVRIAVGEGRSRVAMNRRAMRPADTDSHITFDENNTSQSFGKAKTDRPVLIHEFAGDMRLGANPAGPIDPSVQLVRLDAGGRPFVVMIHYACHGTSLGGRNSKINGEWMGRMQSYVEAQFPGLNSIYLQGAAGDINPRVVGGLDGNPDDINTTHALGEEIGREVVRVFRGLAPDAPAPASIEITKKDILLPRAYRDLAANYADPVLHVPTTVVRLGDLMWVTFPGELFSSIGKFVKAACPAPYAHLVGYTNGSVGYLPEQKAFGEGGYEPAVSRFAPVAEQIYRREITALMKSLR